MGEKVILDHSAGEIQHREAEILLDAVRGNWRMIPSACIQVPAIATA